ncbi:MAG: hypothetical protein JSV23_01400, partial [Promethearchaeota archaeon]
KLLIFSAGNGVFKSREFLIERMDEIQEKHKEVHESYNNFLKNGLSETQVIKKILKKIFKRESIFGRLTQGDISRQNLIISLLNWQLKN